MILKVLDRVLLLGLLPEQGDFLTLKIVRELRENLSFTEEELKRLKLLQSDNRVTWDVGADGDGSQIAIGEKAGDIIADALKLMNEKKSLTEQHLNIYGLFVGTQ